MWENHKSGSVRGIEVLHKEFNYMINRKIKQTKENHIMPTRQNKFIISINLVKLYGFASAWRKK